MVNFYLIITSITNNIINNQIKQTDKNQDGFRIHKLIGNKPDYLSVGFQPGCPVFKRIIVFRSGDKTKAQLVHFRSNFWPVHAHVGSLSAGRLAIP